MYLRSFIIVIYLINVQYSPSQTMDKLTESYNRVLTENYDLPNSFFEKEILANNSLFLKLMFSYKNINDNKISKAKEILNNIKQLENKPFLESIAEMNKGLIEVVNGDKKRGIKVLKNAINIDTLKENKWVRVELYLLLKEDVPYEAWKYLEEALEIDSKFYWALVEKSFGFDENENCEDIIQNLKHLPESYNDSDALNLLGVAQVNCRDFENAKSTLERSMKIKETTNNYYSLGQLHHEYYKDFESAERMYLKSLEIDDSNLDTMNAYSWLLVDMGNFVDAEKKIISMINVSKDQEIYNQIINFYILTNNITKGDEYLKQSVSEKGENYMNEGYNIILKIIKNKPYEDLYKSYKNKYEEFNVLWLNDQIAFFLENINR